MTQTDTWTEDGKTQRYLDAEAAAQRLVASLKRLDEQSANYAAAAIELSAAADATKQLTLAVVEVGEAAKSALEVVASVGGPEVLRQVDATHTALQAVQARVETAALGVAANQRVVGGAAQGIAEVNASLDAVTLGVTANELAIERAAQGIEALGRRVNLVLYTAGAAVILSLISIVLNLAR